MSVMSAVTSVVNTRAYSNGPSSAPRRGRQQHCVCRRWVKTRDASMTPTTVHASRPGVSLRPKALSTLRHRRSSRVHAADASLPLPASKGDDETDENANANSTENNADGFAELVKFTLPTMAIWMSGPVLSMVDTAVVGTSSLIELAAMTPGAVFVDYPAYLISSSLAVATTTLVAQDRLRKAKNNNDAFADSEKTIQHGMALAFLGGSGLSLGLSLIAATTVAAFAGPASAAVVPYALKYATARLWGVPAAMVVAVAQASFLACKSPTQPLLAVAFAAIANLLGDVLLVVGLGWGIAGAAWATVAAQVTMGVALLYLLLKEGKRSKKIESTDAVTDGQGPPALRALPSKIPTLAQTMRFVKIAGPVCFLNTIKIVYVAVIVQAVTAISPECSAANGVMSAIYFFFAVMGDGVAQAAQSFLPPHLGSNQAVKVSVLLLVSAACLGLFNGLLSWFIAVGVPGIFTNSAEVTSIMKQSAPVMSFALMLHTASMGSEGCLLAARDMKFMTACYLPNSLLAYATLAACLAAMGHGGGPCAAFFSVLESMGIVGRMFGLVGELAANILNYFGIVGGAAGAAAMWASMAHFNFMRLAFNVVRMFVPGVGGKKGSPLLRTFVAEG